MAPLAELLREPPEDPFAAEVVAVPAKGVERWLTQRLSHVLGAAGDHADGVCANVQFPSPARMVQETLTAASGQRAEDDPWHPDRLLWPLLEVIDTSVDEVWCSTLAAYLGAQGATDDHRRGRRLSTARHLAALFDSYAAHRPAMLTAWASGDDTDGAGADLDEDLGWQAELWRRLRHRLDTPGPAERLGPSCDVMREHPEGVDLPQRLSFFGPTRLTTAQIQVIHALADHRDVHLWLPHPSDALWRRVAEATPNVGAVRRTSDPTADVPRNPLLSSLGRDAREMQLLLATAAANTTAATTATTATPRSTPSATDHHHPVDPRPDTVLGVLQEALQTDEDSHVGQRHTADPKDRSLQVHACHGPVRQVEVLRDVLVGLLADDPTLEPRDILVMCPDIEDYAPLISAAFGLADDQMQNEPRGTAAATPDPLGGRHHPGYRLRVRLADRALHQTNPVLGTVAVLIDIADARLTASEVLDLAALTPVRRRFGLTDDNIELLRTWAKDSGIRWGRDADDRARFKLQQIGQNTWRAGLDRILLGAAMAEEDHRWVGTSLPLDDVESNDVDLAGRLAELVDRLATVLDQLAGDRTLHQWLDTLADAVQMLTDVSDTDAWQAAQAHRELAQVAVDAGAEAQTVRLTLSDLRALLAGRLEGRPTRANFRTGNLTMCSMVPMRSVPHRVICLLGLDDGAFPRNTVSDGDDVLMRNPCVGERDVRSEDRQLLLDAVLAATEHLVILYTGADPRTNARRPPAVPVGEILDAVDLFVRAPDGEPARTHVVTAHPLQPFDSRNFVDGALGRVDAPFSFDRDALAGAVQTARARQPAPPLLAAPLAPPEDIDADVDLNDLVAFLERPSRAFFRQRLLVSTPGDEDELPDNLSIELGNLPRWSIGDRLVRARLAGVAVETWKQSEVLRGTLPPRRLGERAARQISSEAEPVVAAAMRLRTGEPSTIDVSWAHGGRLVTGTVPDVFGDAVVRAEFSRMSPRFRLRAWAQLLALTLTDPTRDWTAVTIGRGRDEASVSRLGPIPAEVAAQELGFLIDLRTRGLREALPLAAKTSFEYARARGKGESTRTARVEAEKAWTGSRSIPGENAEWPNPLVWGDESPFDVLVASPADADMQDAPPDETTQFGALARRLWDPLLAFERLTYG